MASKTAAGARRRPAGRKTAKAAAPARNFPLRGAPPSAGGQAQPATASASAEPRWTRIHGGQPCLYSEDGSLRDELRLDFPPASTLWRGPRPDVRGWSGPGEVRREPPRNWLGNPRRGWEPFSALVCSACGAYSPYNPPTPPLHLAPLPPLKAFPRNPPPE